MPLEGDYLPSPSSRASQQVEEYESSDGQRANTLPGTDMVVVVLTMKGANSGKIRKTPVMRVEHAGEYAVVASMGGAPTNPQWYTNLKAHPEATIQDGADRFDVTFEEVEGDERAQWWDRAVAAYPPYAEYQEKTDRRIPVLVGRRT